jgi:hypothetical protein
MIKSNPFAFWAFCHAGMVSAVLGDMCAVSSKPGEPPGTTFQGTECLVPPRPTAWSDPTLDACLPAQNVVPGGSPGLAPRFTGFAYEFVKAG